VPFQSAIDNRSAKAASVGLITWNFHLGGVIIQVYIKQYTQYANWQKLMMGFELANLLVDKSTSIGFDGSNYNKEAGNRYSAGVKCVKGGNGSGQSNQ